MKNHWLRPITLVILFCLLVTLPASATPLAAPAGVFEPAEVPNWWITHADAPLTFKNMSPHSLDVTSGGVIHVVYGGDHLYHAWNARGVWDSETVDPAWGVGSFATLAIDSASKLHVAYIDSATSRLKYATNRYGSWQVQTPSSAAAMNATNAAIGVDAVDDPHIVFSSSDGSLHYVFYDTGLGIWEDVENLATATGPLDYPGAFALAVGPLATLHVSYHKHVNATNGSLYYTKRTGHDTWSAPLELALGGNSDGDYNDIALNGSIPHIAASATTTISQSEGLNVVRYTYLDGGSWHSAEVVSVMANNSFKVSPTAIVLRLAGGVPYVAYQDVGYGYDWLKRLDDNTWTSEEAVVTGAAVGSWASFALHSTNLYATYYDTSTLDFSVRIKNASGWQAPITLATNGHNVANIPALTADGLGRSHMTYGDSTSQSLLYARYDGASWLRLTVDSDPVFNLSALDTLNNSPRVLYFGRDGSVRYSYMLCVPVCVFVAAESVDSGLSLPIFRPALAVHAVSGVHAAYDKNGTLVYAKRISADNWSTTAVDTGIYGAVSLALDTNGAPHLMYQKGGSLVHAYLDTSWHTGDIIATGTIFGAYPSFQISPQGVMAAAYTTFSGASAANLVYAEWSCSPNPCAWVPNTLAAKADEIADLAFDKLGVPHIAYYSIPGFDQMFAERTGASTWVTRTIDSRGFLGFYLAIAISPLNGRARIAYTDGTNDDLKLAVEGQPVFLPIIKR